MGSEEVEVKNADKRKWAIGAAIARAIKRQSHSKNEQALDFNYWTPHWFQTFESNFWFSDSEMADGGWIHANLPSDESYR